MESLKAVHKSVRDTLYGWNYSPTDIVLEVDLGYALYCAIGSRVCIKPHIICMCLSEEIVEYGDGLYGINEESTSWI